MNVSSARVEHELPVRPEVVCPLEGEVPDEQAEPKEEDVKEYGDEESGVRVPVKTQDPQLPSP